VKRGPLDNEEAVGGDTERRVMMEASPTSSFIMSGSEFLFQILIMALNTPARFRHADHRKSPPEPSAGSGDCQGNIVIVHAGRVYIPDIAIARAALLIAA
jgi:hypothetical protein